MRRLVLFFLTIFASVSFCSAEKVADSTQIWVAPPVSLFIGFGVGIGLQGNYESRGWIYGSTDVLGLVLIWKSIADCHSPDHHDQDCPNDSNRKLANALLVTSRIGQVVDSTIWSFKNYNKYRTTAFILPNEDGLSLNYAIEF